MSGVRAAEMRWEEFLWEKHHAVALSVAEVEELQPLAVLVKLRSKQKRSGFKIRSVGTLSSLRKHAPDPEDSGERQWQRFDARSRAGLEAAASALSGASRGGGIRTGVNLAGHQLARQSARNVAELVEVKSEPEITLVDASSNSCLFALLASCGPFVSATRLEACVQGVRSVRLSRENTMPLFTGGSPAWKPDLTKLQQLISWDDLPSSQAHVVELWVVTEVKYCKHMSLLWKKGGGTQTGVDVPAEGVALVTGLATGVPVPVPIKASLRLVHDEQTLTVSAAPPRQVKPFAFKAIRLVYDRGTGDLVDKHLDKGDQAPQRRGQASASANEQVEKHYHMADFFETDEQGNLVFQSLHMESELEASAN